MANRAPSVSKFVMSSWGWRGGGGAQRSWFSWIGLRSGAKILSEVA